MASMNWVNLLCVVKLNFITTVLVTKFVGPESLGPVIAPMFADNCALYS